MTSTENTNKYIPMLEERLQKLRNHPFDWAAWKKGTLLILRNAFGDDSAYYKQLLKTDYEYSSWSLRDTGGSSDPVKSSCADLLEISISDLKQQGQTDNPSKNFKKNLEKFLPSEILVQINDILNSEDAVFEKEEKIEQILKEQNSKAIIKSLSSLFVALSNK